MKKNLCLAVIIMLFSLTALSSYAEGTIPPAQKLTREVVAAMTPEEKQARLQEIKVRVEELKAMDKSAMTKVERKEYRAELKELKEDSKLIDPRVYFFVAGLIIIAILVLIIV